MKQYVVDAFSDRVFAGNPAAICILDSWFSDEKMYKIALENCLPETAFAVKTGDKYHLRWFTPGGEIDLCGHATLACAFVLMNYVEKDAERIVFETLSGELAVERKGELFEMDFPAYDLKKVPVTDQMAKAFGAAPVEAWMGRDLLCVFDSEETVRGMKPDLELVKGLDGLLTHVTAGGKDYDCVSRTFSPKMNVPEDPVCGSGHCHIIPYWDAKLKKGDITAYQASPRGGALYCKVVGDRVKMAGTATLYSIADVFVD